MNVEGFNELFEVVKAVKVAELDLEGLRLASAPVAGVRVPRFLPVQQDFAIVVGEETPAADVEAALLGGAGPLATNVALCGANVPVFGNVATLDRLPAEGALVVALPMKIAGGSGGPLRIMARLPDAAP